MAAVDANGNPGDVASGELIESAWGNAVANRVVDYYPTKAAWDAGPHNAGQMYRIGYEIYSFDGTNLHGVRPTVAAAFNASLGNVFGLVQLTTVTLPADICSRIYQWNMSVACSGHSANGNIRIRHRNPGGADIGISGFDSYFANAPSMSVFATSFDYPIGTPTQAISVWVEVGGAGANTNITATLGPVIGYPT